MAITNIVQMIPASKRAQAALNILAHQPNIETINDPNGVDIGDGSGFPQIPKYTDSAWLDQIVERYLKRCNKKGKIIIAGHGVSEEDIFKP